MPYANLSIGLDNTMRQQLLNDVAELKSKMDFLIKLTSTEKKQHLRLGKKASVFFSHSIMLAKQHPEVLPNYFNLADMEQDVQDHHFLSDVLVQISSLQAAIKDTTIALEQESMRAALNIYKHFQAASTQQVVGAQKALETLKPMMNKSGKMKKEK
jgi:DNA-binding FrmR family transcriptional regulator